MSRLCIFIQNAYIGGLLPNGNNNQRWCEAPEEMEMSLQIGSVRDVLEWAKSQDPEETYSYYECEDCALARYARSRGVKYERAYDLGIDIERIVSTAGEKGNRCNVKMYELVATLQTELAAEQTELDAR